MPRKDAFDILGVTASDDAWTIRRAWRRLVKIHHPDRNRGDRQAARARLEEVNEAYDEIVNAMPFHKAEAPKTKTKPHPTRAVEVTLPVVRQTEPTADQTEGLEEPPVAANDNSRAAVRGFRRAASLIARPARRRTRLA